MIRRKWTARRTVRRSGRGAQVARAHAWGVTFWASREADSMAEMADRYGLRCAAEKMRAWAHGWLAACGTFA
jgi:hypothetical protein